jgi:hypothetical protein
MLTEVLCKSQVSIRESGREVQRSDLYMIDVQKDAILWLLLPPLGLLMIGCVGLWVANGFQSRHSK